MVVFVGLPANFFSIIQKAEASTFVIQTGIYTGNGTDNRQITGIGFQPEMVMVKDLTTSGSKGIVFKTSVMPGETTIALSETDAVSTSNIIQSLDSDGFTIGTDQDINQSNELFYWVAFAGSDCTSSGTFCVGSYTGNGTSQNITSVGFQPDFIAVKRSGVTAGMFKTPDVPGTQSASFADVTNIVSGAINSIDSTGFTIGNNAAVNTNGDTYYYFAFKNSSVSDVGSYTGNATDNRIINSSYDSGLTFEPSFVFIKSSGSFSPVFYLFENYGDASTTFIDSGVSNDRIQKLYSTGGFQIGASTLINTNAVEHYYLVLGGANPRTSGTEDFDFATGSYTGTGVDFSLTGLSFAPDLVIVKHNDQAADQGAVFRLRVISGNTTSLFLNSTQISAAIVSLDSDGFTIGTNPTVNTLGDTYYWTAFGNATTTDKAANAKNFFTGQYYGTATNDTLIGRLAIDDPDMVTVKLRTNNIDAYWSKSDMGNLSFGFRATAALADQIKSFQSGGFVIGNGTVVNNNGTYIDYFGFGDSTCDESGRFCIGSYTGNGTSQNITSVGFQPDFVWVKKRTGGTARAGILKTSSQNSNDSSYFINLPTITGRITNLIDDGFSVSSGVESNENTFTYDFAAWNGKRYNQSGYRFFENIDSTDVGSVLAAQDTPITLVNPGDDFRLRINTRVDYGNLFDSGKNFKLQYVDKGSGTCASPIGGTPSSYTDVDSGTHIAFLNNPTPSNATSLTANGNDPTDGGRTIVNQSYVESNPFTNNQGAITNALQTGKWDFSLTDNSAGSGATYCLRIVGSENGTPLDVYNVYPEVTTVGGSVAQEISMSISDNTVGFGTLSSSAARYATGDTLGSVSDTLDAHTVTASTNASGGYVLTLSGQTLTCTSCGGADINPIGDTATSSSPGTEQFGLRAIVNSGTGSVSSPYNQSSQFAFDVNAFPDEIAIGLSDNTPTEYGFRYLGNITSVTDAGSYSGILTYTVTASY